MKSLTAAIRHFLGKDLIARDIPLDFSFPSISERVFATHVFGGNYYRTLKESSENPIEFLSLLKTRIKHINRCALKPRERVALNQEILKSFYPLAIAQMTRHARTGGIPENEERKHILNSIIDISQVLTISHQILFHNYYSRSNFLYARSRKNIEESAFRIIELLLIKQQAKSLRYQSLVDLDWKLANTIFYIMFNYEKVDQPSSTLKSELKIEGKRCLSELYIALHMVARFDPLRSPTNLQWVTESYIKSVPNAITIQASNTRKKISSQHLSCYCHSGTPLSSSLLDKPHAIIFDCSNLFKAIREDCLNLIKAVKANSRSDIPTRFLRFDEQEQFVISEQLLIGLKDSKIDCFSEAEVPINDFRIFVGFQAVFALLHHKQSEFCSEERLADALAKRSAVIAEDEKSVHNSTWSFLFKNDHMIRLSTQESNYTTPMSIGSLLAYGIGEDVNRPSLAVVSRIFRLSNRVVIIDLNIITNYAEAVALKIKILDKIQIKNAIIVRDARQSEKLSIISKSMDILYHFDQFTLIRNNVPYPLKLDSISMATTDFSLFSTTLKSKLLGINETAAA